MLHQNFKQIKLANGFFVLPARNSPKENSGASGGFLPKPLLLRLRHPNSKTNQSKFWQILSSPKNSFAKTSSALKPSHTARILGGQNPKKKNVLSILEKITPAKIRKSKEHFFFLGLPSEARRWRGFRRAYDFGQSHHASGACHIICFGNRCELGTIETPRKEKFYTYLLESLINKSWYIGYTSDLRNRFISHNKGKNIATNGKKPWKLIYCEAYVDRVDVKKRERFLKSRFYII